MSDSQYAGRVRIRGCALVVRNEALLLVNQTVPTRSNPVWLAPGGEVEMGESVKEAAKRETLEETGLHIDPVRLIAVHEFVEPPFHAVELFFLSEISGGSLIVGTDPEHSAIDQQILDTAFINFDRLKDLSIIPEFLKGAREILESSSDGKVMHVTD